jgi:inner membrane transporter RhtA
LAGGGLNERHLAGLLVLGGIASVQWGAAAATTLFDEVGPGGTVFLRVAISAVLLVVLWRPVWGVLRGAAARDIVAFGLVLAAMNWSFYQALERIPLGIAVTIEFVGPLGVAFLHSRRRLDLLWAGCAAAGLLLLAPFGGGSIDALGALFAFIAGACWGAYILLSARVGRAVSGGSGLAIAMTVAAVVLIPAGIADGGSDLLVGHTILIGAAVAVLSSAIPYSLELEALRRIPENTFGVLMSLEPAVAALVGFIALNQDLHASEIAAIALVLIASAGALGSAGEPRAPEA